MLCTKHHKQIDDQVASFPEDRVIQIKRNHERWVADITADPIHPMGIRIYGRSLRIEDTGVIRAEGPQAFIELGVDDITNAGTVITSQTKAGTRLADHLRVIADHLYGDAREWGKPPTGQAIYSTFLAQYVSYGRALQAVELYDSAMRAGLETGMARTDFETATSPDAAREVADEMVRWAETLDQLRLNGHMRPTGSSPA